MNLRMTPSPLKLLDHSKLLLRIAKHQKLLEHIKAALPPPLDSHCLDCCINDKSCLLVFCENSAWAFNLRFYAEHMLTSARNQGERINSVQIRVISPILGQSPQKARPQHFRHQAAATAISDVAATMMQDDLGKSLDRLAATLSSM
jgi:hypothetical protein